MRRKKLPEKGGLKAYHIILSGRVQGVALRYYTREKAKTLGIHGWVRNLETGQVEIFCQGAHPQIEMFTEWLREGPDTAKIDGFEMRDEPPEEFVEGFEIRY